MVSHTVPRYGLVHSVSDDMQESHSIVVVFDDQIHSGMVLQHQRNAVPGVVKLLHLFKDVFVAIARQMHRRETRRLMVRWITRPES